jgi:fructokinase
VSFDPNCRPNLVHDKAGYVRLMNALAARADIVRLSDSDFAFLYGGSDHAAKAKTLLSAGVGLFVVTRGIRGAIAWHGEAGAVEVDAQPAEVVDTVGAGDSFQAGLLFALKTIGRIAPGSLARLSADELDRVLTFAAACAAFTCGRAGADPPRLVEIGTERIRALRG